MSVFEVAGGKAVGAAVTVTITVSVFVATETGSDSTDEVDNVEDGRTVVKDMKISVTVSTEVVRLPAETEEMALVEIGADVAGGTTRVVLDASKSEPVDVVEEAVLEDEIKEVVLEVVE